MLHLFRKCKYYAKLGCCKVKLFKFIRLNLLLHMTNSLNYPVSQYFGVYLQLNSYVANQLVMLIRS